jgi:aspartyl-tRNA(Asn)/glutamyl-tRNA(Gln) amidotransferase subunit C
MITKETVLKISNLARLQISEAEAAAFTKQLNETLDNFNKIAKVDTSNIEPLLTPTEITPHLREDKVVPGLGAETMLANAPDKSGNLFKVPPVV